MNMEAMGIFGSETQDERKLGYEQTEVQGNLSCIDPNPMGFSRSVAPNLNQTTTNIFPSNPSVLVNKPKIESKDHKWK
jgi:hypothetical protein